MKNYFVLAVMLFLMIVLHLWKYINDWLALFHARTDLLRKKWKTARKERLLWRDEHWLNFNFDDPEYQRLWEIEIGAEDLYLIRINSVCHGASVSWQDYTHEREESEHQEW
jgi:hypothetical protein